LGYKEETKTILGYNCCRYTTFRGRELQSMVYYRTSGVGPWKFDSLPGAILEVNSDDYVVGEAIGIIINKQNQIILDLQTLCL
jgi:GLPGLI family protein